jgi:hypothetical protein
MTCSGRGHPLHSCCWARNQSLLLSLCCGWCTWIFCWGCLCSGVDMMTLVNAVFFCGWLVRITQMVVVGPLLNEMSGLFTVTLISHRDVEHTHFLVVCSSLPKET